MKLAVPIREKTLKKALQQIKRVPSRANFIELWLDHFAGADYTEIIKATKKPLIAVCRAPEEKGSFRGSEEERIAVLMRAVEKGFSQVDCGVQTSPVLIKKLAQICKKKLIISKHIWNKTPSLDELQKVYMQAKNYGAHIVKIATFIKNYSDAVTLFEFTVRAQARGEKVIVVGMGKKSTLARIGCGLLGSYLTYVALDAKSTTASGQLTMNEVKNYTL